MKQIVSFDISRWERNKSQITQFIKTHFKSKLLEKLYPHRASHELHNLVGCVLKVSSPKTFFYIKDKTLSRR